MVTRGNAQVILTHIPDDLITREKLEAAVEARIVALDTPIDLSGAAETYYLLHAERACTIVRITIVYIEGTSADAGVAINAGDEGSATYFGTLTSSTGQAAYASENMTLSNTDLAAGDTLIINCAGGKVGAGTFVVEVEYYID